MKSLKKDTAGVVGGCWSYEREWKSPTLVGAQRREYLEKLNLEPFAGRGRPKSIHPVEQAVRASLSGRTLELGKPGHDRFAPFRIELATLFLGLYSPSFVLGLLRDVFPVTKSKVGSKIQWGLGKPSVHTIEGAYARVEGEICQGKLVSKLPVEWCNLLSKYNLGPWHPDAPDWIKDAFISAGFLGLMPPIKSRRGRVNSGVGGTKQILAPDGTIANSPISADASANHSREAAPAMDPKAKNKRLKRELNAIRLMFPNFKLQPDEEFLAWDLGLSAVRKAREDRALGTTQLDRRPDINDTSTPARTTATKQVNLVAPNESDPKKVSLRDGSGEEGTWILREHRVDLLRRSPECISGTEWETYFPDLVSYRHDDEDNCDAVYRSWRFGENRKIIENDLREDITEFAWKLYLDSMPSSGYDAGYLYGEKIPESLQSIVLLSILEQILITVFNLDKRINDPASGKPILPLAYVWREDDAAEIIPSQADDDFFCAIAPLWMERLAPRSKDDVPDGYHWLPGRGFMLESDIERAVSIGNGEIKSSSSRFWKSEKLWARSVSKLHHATYWSSNGQLRYGRHEKSKYGFMDLPFAVRPISTVSTQGWLENASSLNLWDSSGKYYKPLVSKLIATVPLRIHRPSVRIVENYYSKLAEMERNRI